MKINRKAFYNSKEEFANCIMASKKHKSARLFLLTIVNFAAINFLLAEIPPLWFSICISVLLLLVGLLGASPKFFELCITIGVISTLCIIKSLIYILDLSGNKYIKIESEDLYLISHSLILPIMICSILVGVFFARKIDDPIY